MPNCLNYVALVVVLLASSCFTQVSVCGNGQIDGAEQCDDGAETIRCNLDCTIAVCGDGRRNLMAGEDCDEGGETVTCDRDCTLPQCGDQVVNLTAGEACDDGAETTRCDADCTQATCGDGTLNRKAGESCDDGGETSFCNGDCTVSECGDQYVNASSGEECDDGAESASCDADCTFAICGDGTINTTRGEDCEDGNILDHDGCSSVCRLPIRMDLSIADLKLVGEAPEDAASLGLSGAGDVNGDGFGDLLVGAYVHDAGGDGAGAAYLISGPRAGTLDLSKADAKFVGEEDDSFTGFSVAGGGDINRDGFDDILIGAYGNGPAITRRGAVYLIHGPVTGLIDLAYADAKLTGEVGYLAGYHVASAGDVNGDGFVDVVAGAIGYEVGESRSGAAYVIYGPFSGFQALEDAGATLVGEDDDDFAGYSVAGPGDVDGDGLDDIVVGALWEAEGGSTAGAAYLVLGPPTSTVNLADADAKLVGEAASNKAGRSTAGGDIDGDGLADIIVGADENAEGGTGAGAAYVVYGPVNGTVTLAAADAKLVGEAALDRVAFHVANAGDVDGDGNDDILVGAPFKYPYGAAYLVLGAPMGTVDLMNADARFTGDSEGDQAGYRVAGAGDVDGDGLADMLVGDIKHKAGGESAGTAFLVLGQRL